jgi:hypothetical protein
MDKAASHVVLCDVAADAYHPVVRVGSVGQ